VGWPLRTIWHATAQIQGQDYKTGMQTSMRATNVPNVVGEAMIKDPSRGWWCPRFILYLRDHGTPEDGS